MTSFIVTMSERFSLVSQDSFCVARQEVAGSAREGRVAGDFSEALGSAFTGRGRSFCKPPLAFGAKFFVLPHLHMVIGGAGDFGFITAWASIVNVSGYLLDAAGVDGVAPECLRDLSGIMNLSMASSVFHVGWDREGDKPVGFLYANGDGFSSTGLGLGHSLCPAPNPDDEEYGVLHGMWTKAATSGDIALAEKFHVGVAANQHRAYRAGLFGQGLGIGGQLHTARIDRDGISVCVSHEFPDFRTELAFLGGAGRDIFSRLGEMRKYAAGSNRS